MYFGTNVPKKVRQKKEFELCQNDFVFTKFFELYQLIRYSQRFQVPKYSHTLKLYTLKVLLNENWISFFSSSDMQKFHHLLGCYTICISSLTLF